MTASRNVIVISDVDDTLLQEIRAFAKNLVWTGGSPSFWRSEINHLKQEGQKQGLKIFFGIASGKFESPNCLTVREHYFITKPEPAYARWQQLPGCGLASVIDKTPSGEPLEFKTTEIIGDSSRATDKVELALFKAQELLARDGILVNSNDIFLIDNDSLICQSIAKKTAESKEGPTSIDASGLKGQSIPKQQELIHGYFVTIAKKLGFDLRPVSAVTEVKATPEQTSGSLGVVGQFGSRAESGDRTSGVEVPSTRTPKPGGA